METSSRFLVFLYICDGWFRKCLEVSVSMLQKWRWGISDHLHNNNDILRASNCFTRSCDRPVFRRGWFHHHWKDLSHSKRSWNVYHGDGDVLQYLLLCDHQLVNVLLHRILHNDPRCAMEHLQRLVELTKLLVVKKDGEWLNNHQPK